MLLNMKLTHSTKKVNILFFGNQLCNRRLALVNCKKVSRTKLYLVLVLVPTNHAATMVPDFKGCNVLCGCVVLR